MFSKAENFSIPNGHHIIVKNNDVKRPYTPIKNTSDEVHLYIKQYPNGRISSYLANLNIMDKIVVDSESIKNNTDMKKNIQYNVNVNEIIKNLIKNISLYKIKHEFVFNPITYFNNSANRINFKYTIPNQEIVIELDLGKKDGQLLPRIKDTNIIVPENYNTHNQSINLYSLRDTDYSIDYLMIDIVTIKFIKECLSRT